MTWSRFQIICKQDLQLDSPWPFFFNSGVFFEGCHKISTHTLRNCVMLFLYHFLIFKGCNTYTQLQIHYVYLLSLPRTALDRKHISYDSDTYTSLFEWLTVKRTQTFPHVHTCKRSPVHCKRQLCSQWASIHGWVCLLQYRVQGQ